MDVDAEVLEVREVTRARHEQLRTHGRVHLVAPVDDQNVQLETRELDRDRETDRSRTDDGDIMLVPPRLDGQRRSRHPRR